jgi:hypothetical protein
MGGEARAAGEQVLAEAGQEEARCPVFRQPALSAQTISFFQRIRTFFSEP